jgi:hypothetical protein
LEEKAHTLIDMVKALRDQYLGASTPVPATPTPLRD